MLTVNTTLENLTENYGFAIEMAVSFNHLALKGRRNRGHPLSAYAQRGEGAQRKRMSAYKGDGVPANVYVRNATAEMHLAHQHYNIISITVFSYQHV